MSMAYANLLFFIPFDCEDIQITTLYQQAMFAQNKIESNHIL